MTTDKQIEEIAEIKRLIVEKDPDDNDKFLRRLWELATQAEEAITSFAAEVRREERERIIALAGDEPYLYIPDICEDPKQ